MGIRPYNDSILIKVDEESKVTSGGIIKPDDVHEGIIGTAVVVDVGPGVWSKPTKKGVAPVRIPTGLEPGDGVTFIKFIGMTKTQEKLQQWHLPEGHLLIKPNDVLLVYDRKNPPRFE